MDESLDNDRTEQASVAEYQQKIVNETHKLIRESGRPPWPSHYVYKMVGGSRIFVPDDPIEPEDVIAVFLVSIQAGIAAGRKQFAKFSVLFAAISFVLGFVLGHS